jgi:hypothetical protein
VPPPWLVVVAWIALAVGFACALGVLWDVFVRGYRQHMAVMGWVWPITALYAGPVGLWLYLRFGRPASTRWQREHDENGPPRKPSWASTAVGVSHCGAGCTLGDIVAATTVFLLGLEIAGRALWPELIGDYVLALALGLLFQYWAIKPMRELTVGQGIVAAAKADFLSLTAFEIGLFGWMVVQALVLVPAGHSLHPDSPVYWAGMQLGMCLGFLTAYPVNAWLIRRGVKEAM